MKMTDIFTWEELKALVYSSGTSLGGTAGGYTSNPQTTGKDAKL